MKRIESSNLKEYVFNNLLEEKGISLKDISIKTEYITNSFIGLKDLLVSSGIMSPNDQISLVKIINHNNINYLIIRNRRGNYIVFDVTNNYVLSDDDKYLFDQAFFVKHFNESVKLSYDNYSFSKKEVDIKPIYRYVLSHEQLLDIDKTYIFFTKEDEIAKVLVYYNITTGETVIHFKTQDNSINQQIYMLKGFKCIDSVTKYNDLIPLISVDKDNIPNFILDDKKTISK